MATKDYDGGRFDPYEKQGHQPLKTTPGMTQKAKATARLGNLSRGYPVGASVGSPVGIGKPSAGEEKRYQANRSDQSARALKERLTEEDELGFSRTKKKYTGD